MKVQMRRARRRLARALDKCTIDDLRRATALQDWFRKTCFVPGDQITITFDGDKSDVILTGLSNRHFRKEDQDLLNDLSE